MIYLVRQGQTDWNKQRKFNGCTETELNQTGIAQARQQADNLKSIHFDACYCSPQKRTRQTCEIICGEGVVFDERLAEINCGEFEGIEETAEAVSQFWQAVQRGDRGVESFKSFAGRNGSFCDMVVEQHSGKNVLIVTHAANARIIHYYFSGKPKDYDFTKAVVQSGGLLVLEYPAT